MVTGTVTGHDSNGDALILNQFGNGSSKHFDDLRLARPFDRMGPNWLALPAGGQILQPPPDILQRFRELLSRRIPPGPTYLDLAMEVWSRGFEVFIVGGTVRDGIVGEMPNDVDLVTTMPLSLALRFIPAMYRSSPSQSRARGFIRIGGTPASGDPFVDFKVFSDSLVGTNEAVFGVGFDRDVAHRDFACNAIYYDPMNEVFIDPTGVGIADAETRKLTPICRSNDPHQHAQIFIRTIKFAARGFDLVPAMQEWLRGELAAAVPGMRGEVRLRYLSAQVLSKCASKQDHGNALEQFRQCMINLGVGPIWDAHFQPHVGKLLQ